MPKSTDAHRIGEKMGRLILRLYHKHGKGKIGLISNQTGIPYGRVVEYLRTEIPVNRRMPKMGRPSNFSEREIKRLQRIGLASSSWIDYAKRAGRTIKHPVLDRTSYGVELGCIKCHKNPRDREQRGKYCRSCWYEVQAS